MNLIRKAVGADDRYGSPAVPTVVVHVSLKELLDRLGLHPAEVDPYGPVSTLTLERLLCDAEVHRHITGPYAATIEFGRGERLVKGHQRLALIARDRHCQFPGCDRPPSMCHAHHITPWETGGQTDLPNLALLCHRHHHAVHEGGFHCERLPHGQLQFRRPDRSILDQPRPG